MQGCSIQRPSLHEDLEYARNTESGPEISVLLDLLGLFFAPVKSPSDAFRSTVASNDEAPSGEGSSLRKSATAVT